MPKGEHFKKPNPRVIQVSFKVNQKEFDALQELVKSKDTSVAEFFRSIILNGESVPTPAPAPAPKPAAKKEEAPAPAAAMPKPTRKKAEPKSKKAKSNPPFRKEDEEAPNQMSLF